MIPGLGVDLKGNWVKFLALALKLKPKALLAWYGVTVRALDLRSSGRGLDSRSGRYQAA